MVSFMAADKRWWCSSSSSSSSSSHAPFPGDLPSPLPRHNRVPFAWEERPGVPISCSSSASSQVTIGNEHHKVHTPSASAHSTYQDHAQEHSLMRPLPLPPARSSPAEATTPYTRSRASARRRSQLSIQVNHDPFLLAVKACSKSEDTQFHRDNNAFHQNVNDCCTGKQHKASKFSPRLPLLIELLQEEAERASSSPTNSKTRASPKLTFLRKFSVATNNLSNVNSLYANIPLLSKLFENHNSTTPSCDTIKPSTIKPKASVHSEHPMNTHASIKLNSILNRTARTDGTVVSFCGRSCTGCSALEHADSIIRIP